MAEIAIMFAAFIFLLAALDSALQDIADEINKEIKKNRKRRV